MPLSPPAARALGWGFVGVCVSVVALSRRNAIAPELSTGPMPVTVIPTPQPPPAVVEAPPTAMPTSDATGWFQRVKPYCNAVEVSVLQWETPPPATVDGAGYHAACFALAGRIDDARHIIDSLSGPDQRRVAASIVFDVGHPVADAGDDKSAGPIMELVVGYNPENYMAVYHAGMAEFALDQRDRARRHLRAFMKLYAEEDGWRASARRALQQLGDSTGAAVAPLPDGLPEQ